MSRLKTQQLVFGEEMRSKEPSSRWLSWRCLQHGALLNISCSMTPLGPGAGALEMVSGIFERITLFTFTHQMYLERTLSARGFYLPCFLRSLLEDLSWSSEETGRVGTGTCGKGQVAAGDSRRIRSACVQMAVFHGQSRRAWAAEGPSFCAALRSRLMFCG